jgi:hypothetical protein
MKARDLCAIGIVSSAIAYQSFPHLAQRAESIEARYCVRGECPSPMDGAGELGRLAQIRAAMSSSSNFSTMWQLGNTGPNVAPYL